MDCPYRDTESSRDPAQLHPRLRQLQGYLFAKWAAEYPSLPVPFVTATYRNCADQGAMVNRGVSCTHYGQSFHNAVRVASAGDELLPHIQFESDGPEFVPCALAFDISFLNPDNSANWGFHLYERMGALAERVGLEWGGRWPQLVDGAHYQVRMQRGNQSGLPLYTEGRVRLDQLALPPDYQQVMERPSVRADGWLHILHVNGTIIATTPIGEEADVVQRISPSRKRIYTDVREG